MRQLTTRRSGEFMSRGNAREAAKTAITSMICPIVYRGARVACISGLPSSRPNRSIVTRLRSHGQDSGGLMPDSNLRTGMDRVR